MAIQGGINRLIDELAGEALKSHLHNVRSHSQLRRRIADGELTDREVNEAYSAYASDHAATYRKAAADLTIRYYQELSELGAQYSQDFYRQMLNGSASAREPGRAGGHEPWESGDDRSIDRVPIELHGRAGHEIVARFNVENTDPTPTTVEFEFEPCRAPHGESFHAPITVQPARLELEPGGRAEVLLRVALMPEVFVPGLIYRQTILAVGGKPLALDVALWVEYDDVPMPPAPESTTRHTEAVTKKAATKRPAPRKVAAKAAPKKAAPRKVARGTGS